MIHGNTNKGIKRQTERKQLITNLACKSLQSVQIKIQFSTDNSIEFLIQE